MNDVYPDDIDASCCLECAEAAAQACASDSLADEYRQAESLFVPEG